MKLIANTLHILCIVLLLSSARALSADSIADRYISLALQGNLSEAGALFSSDRTDSEMAVVTEISKQFQARFVDQGDDQAPETGDSLADAIVSAYRKYWALTLMGHLSFKEGEGFLTDSLEQVLSTAGAPGTAGDSRNVFEKVGQVLRARGFYSLDTPAPPLRDLFLWKTEENRNYSVRLSDRTQQVRVTFMSDLYSTGWKQYATFGLVSTSGWVEDGRLYCVSWAYDRTSENFEVSYLKHESRHLADFERFPEMESATLEYRAKLTELIFASNSQRRLLDDFTNKSALNPDSPHSHANYLVTRDVYQELFGRPFPESWNPWQEADAHAVSRAARILLQQNTAMLQTDSP